MVQRGPMPIPNETWEDAYVRLTRCITMVRNMVNKISHYGPTDVLITLPSRGSDAQMVRSTLPVRSNTVQLLPQPSRSSTPSLIASAYQPQRRELEQRSADEPPVTLLPQKPRACRSCGHMGHETSDCPVLFYTDANNDLIDWVNSTLGKLWAAEGYNECDSNTKLPGYEVRYLNRLPSEFTKSMLFPPKGEKRSHVSFDKSKTQGQQFSDFRKKQKQQGVHHG